MNFYEELLTLGQHLHDQERAALYKYLLTSEKTRIANQASELTRVGEVSESIADGEIFFTIKENNVSYSTCKKGTTYLYKNVRESNLGLIPALKLRRIMAFIAQAEVEVIWNFPLPGINAQQHTGYTIISYPFADLRYYSDGKGRISGLFKKLRQDNSEILSKLQAS